eukprot:COSAG02_NODE_7303_length_3075_cov_2.418683_2_plen_94_part_00
MLHQPERRQAGHERLQAALRHVRHEGIELGQAERPAGEVREHPDIERGEQRLRALQYPPPNTHAHDLQTIRQSAGGVALGSRQLTRSILPRAV